MAAFVNTFTGKQTKNTCIVISLLFLLHLTFALDESLVDQDIDLLDRHRRAVVPITVDVQDIRENVSSDVTLFDLTSRAPNRIYVITNNSAGIPGLFQVVNGKLTINPNAPADQRQLFDYEKYKTFQVMINATNQTDPTDVLQLTINIHLLDVNDEPPVFTNKPVPFLATLSASAGPGLIVYTVTAVDYDSSPDLVFSIDQVTLPDQTPVIDRFAFTPYNGNNQKEQSYNIITKGPGGYQANMDYTIKVTVVDRNSQSGLQQTSASIFVRIGLREPQFFEQSYKGRIYESTPTNPYNLVLEQDSSNKLGIQVLQFQSGALTYTLLQNGVPSPMFDLRSEDGVQRIISKAYIDYETLTVVSLIIRVTELSTGLSSSAPITIYILDENDNSPIFFAPQYSVTVREDLAVGSSVLAVSASDRDSGLNGVIIFSIMNNTYFGVRTSNINNTYIGEVFVKSPLDYDSKPSSIQFFVVASDRGIPVQTSQVQVTVTLQNVNDNAPTIVNTTTTINLNETTMVNSIVMIVQASDIDGDGVKFYFQGNTEVSDIFQIRPTNGQIFLKSSIPADRNSYILKVIAVDDDTCCAIKTAPRTSTATFTINIVGVNVNKPTFTNCSLYDSTASVKEQSPIGTPVIQVKATDPDRGENGVVVYRIETPDPNSPVSGVFEINSQTGNITVKRNIVRDKYGYIQVTVVGSNPPLVPLMEGRCTFRVRIIDINDHPPVFQQSVIEISVSISNKPPDLIYVIGATDEDDGENANITYSFGPNSNDTQETFSLNTYTGAIRLSNSLSLPKYTLNIIANDNGKDPGPKTANATVIVNVNFDTAKPPQWINQTSNSTIYEVSENAPRDTVITSLSCRSNVSGQIVEIRVYDYGETIITDSKYFYIIPVVEAETTQVNLALRTPLDYEVKREYKIYLVCQSVGTAVVLRAELLDPTVKVLDANDEIPQFVGLNPFGRYTGAVIENSPGGTSVAQVSAVDHDTTPQYSTVFFALNGTYKDFFQIKYLTNNSADILTTNLLNPDRENISHYSVQILAMDGAPASPPNVNNASLPNIASRYIDITVTDVNDNQPSFKLTLYAFNVSENAAVNSVVYTVTADDPDEIDQILGLEYRFTAGNINNTFNVFSVTGEIRVGRKLDYDNPQEPKIYNITMIALDQGQAHTATTMIQIFILDENDNNPIFNPPQYIVRNVVTEEDKTITPENPRFLVTVTATDADVNRWQTAIRYYLYQSSQPDIDKLFRVEEISGNVSLIGPLDRDIPPYYQTITVEAKDERIDPRSGFADVIVFCIDINDNSPVFNAQLLQGSVPENSANTYVMTVVATDADEGNNSIVMYAATDNQPNATLSAMFTVSKEGNIYTTNNVTYLDRESITQVFLVIRAYDLGNPSRSTTATATITVTDVNDQSPYFERPLYSASVSEKQTSGKVLFVPAIEAIDLDSDPKNKQLVFTLIGEPDETKFFIVQSVGSEAVISIAQPIDYETDPHNFTFILSVTDNGPGHTNSTKVYISVLDFNDNPPVFNPAELYVVRVEEEPPGTVICTFTATDRDEGINAEIEYSIVRASDPRYEFYIDPITGVVTNRKPLDREVQESYTVLFLATDKGEIPLTGTATLYLTLNDTNDNAPRFLEDYHPVVQENVPNNNALVQTIQAYDPDTIQNGPPFGFKLPTPCDELACKYFSLTVNPVVDGNYTANVTTSTTFDRESVKIYRLPIVMWDTGGRPGSQTATNTLTITIGDENDNTLYPGNQDILIYNYEGLFSQVEIGRVYVNDLDDWDLPDKTFTYLSPDNLKPYFLIDSQTGMITLNQSLSPNDANSPYQFKVNVYDRKFDKTVTSTVSVIIQIITDETVRKAGGVRLNGITAEEFIKPPQNAATGSKYQLFRQNLASMLGYPSMNNIEIVSLNDGDGFLDVRFSAHGSPYVNPSQGESAIMLNKGKFEQDMGLTVIQVPINLCMEENSDIGCYNFLDVTHKPELVNSNGTSYVIMRTTLSPEEGCVDTIYPDPIECEGDYCFNGGTCIKDDWGKLSCACNPGFDGPRCQQLHHSFDGQSASFYEGLSACSAGRTSIDFITLQENGLIMYSGPITDIGQTDARDYLILELKAGYPSLRLNLGGQEVSLLLTGQDRSNNPIMGKLNDGMWHHLDIDRDNQRVTLTVDHCKYAATTNGTVSDWSPCRISGTVPGPDVLLNVRSLLQLGGRYPATGAPPYPSGVSNTGFNGCLRNLMHNSKLYDLYYKDVPSWKSGTNGCPKEESICGQDKNQPVCGQNATCEARWQPDELVSCRCNPGYYGSKCAKEAPTKDLKTNSYFSWNLPQALITATRREGSFQMMFRTRQTTGTLFALTNVDLKTILVKLLDGILTLSYDMGAGTNTLKLSNANASIGQWSTLRVERYGNEFLFTLDGGEGRNFIYQTANTGLGVFFELQPRITVGALISSGDVISDYLISTCVRDVRFNDKWLPLTTDQNSDPDAGAPLARSQGVEDGCVREDCVNPTVCPPGATCYPLWEKDGCRCTAGYIIANNLCVPSCNPNPCLNFGMCRIENGVPLCTCAAGWTGPTCNAQLQVNPEDSGLGDGAIAGIVIAIIVLLILLILLLIFLFTRKRSEKEKIIEVDPDDDFIRENVVFYDEEGAGEEDHAAYDITLLQRPMKETNTKPVYNPTTENEMRRRNAPQVDRPDVAPRGNRPDVGTFIKDRINDAENDDPNTDSTRAYNFEGGSSDAGSLSSLNTSSSGGSQDYDYLSNWGPKFAKLADMYGAGQNMDDV